MKVSFVFHCFRSLLNLTFYNFTAAPFSHAQPDDEVAATDDSAFDPMSCDRRDRKRKRMLKELDSLNADNAGKRERDRMALWRKMQKFISRNDDIATEYVHFYLFTFH